MINELRYRLKPDIIVIAIPNGDLRHPRVGRRLKAEGVLPGSPDLVFARPHGKTFWMEMKAPNGKISDSQVGMHFRLRKNNHDIVTCKSVEEALAELTRRDMLR